MEDYKPFGDEWVAHLMRLPKKEIISLYKEVCIKQLRDSYIPRITEQLNIAKKALYLISSQTEDMFPPFRDTPRSKMVEIADEAIKEIDKLTS